jgi:DNA-binding transcriptional MerR regulator
MNQPSDCLLRPLRRPSGYREYRDEDAAAVRGIRLLLGALGAGLGTATIAELLPWEERSSGRLR